MSNQFSAISPQLFTSGQAAKVFMGTPYERGEEIPTITITLSTAVDIGDTTAEVAALPETIYEGTRMNFGTEDAPLILYSADQVAAGATEIPIKPAKVAVAPGDCELEAWIPLFSVKTINTDNQQQEISDNVCSSLATAKAISSVSGGGSISGPKIHTDPGLEVINTLQNQFQGYQVRVWKLNALERGGQYADCYFAKSEQTSQNAFDQVTFNPIVDGNWKDLAINA
jgi:hypothetical protein